MVAWIVRIVVVLALLGAAAALATPRGRLPLALRGVRRILRKDLGAAPDEAPRPVSPLRRIAAFVFVILAALVALAA